MKLGPNLRKKYTKCIEIARKFSGLVDRAIWLALDPSKFKMIRNKEIDKILVVLINEQKGNVGGDFCLLGVLNYFKKVYSKVEVAILADKSTIKTFGFVPGIEMIEYQGVETLRDIRGEHFKAALFINQGPVKIKQFLFIPYRISLFYYSFRDFLSLKTKLFITRRPFIKWGTHMVEMEFKMFEALGFKFKKKKTIFYHSKGEEDKVNSFLKSNNVSKGNKTGKFIVIHPGGKFVVEALERNKIAPHLWSFEGYAEVADYFSKKEYKIIITGTGSESILAEKIIKESKNKKGIINTCGKLTIREVGALLEKARFLIATDTSIVHVAYQVGVPIVELMGPSYPKIVGAWPTDSKKHKILFDNGPCAYSMKKTECPEDIPCMQNISVNDVEKAGDELLRLKFK
ncbi:glycosyltransferase family 9 protein [Candidatus Pacearchaeota archaeon]|nr:glycosyltransferase family 9 protein [Candidatus Pacearchaeota archaeon]